MTPASARKTLGRYVAEMAARQASHIYLRSGAPPAIRVQGDALVLPGAVLSSRFVEALARACMPASKAEQFDVQGDASYVVRAVELRRRFLITVCRRGLRMELEIHDADEPPSPMYVPFEPAGKPPTLIAEVVPE